MVSSANYDHRRGPVRRAAAISVLAALFLALLKTSMGIVTGSLGILSEGIHSGLDLVAAAITFVAVKRASLLPDGDHQYGHGKIENFAALAETIILWVTCFWIISEAIRRIEFQEFPEPTPVGIAIMMVSLFVDYERSGMLYRTARKFGSQALEADGLHFRMDMISSGVVLVGLGFVSLNLPIADPLAAFGVSIVIFVASYRLAHRAYDSLTDKAPEGISDEVRRRCSSIAGVTECKRIRVRRAGPDLFVEVVVGVDESMPVTAAHEITDSLEQALASVEKRVDVVVHVEPFDITPVQSGQPDLYSTLKRVVAADHVVPNLHNVKIYETATGIDVEADIEMRSDITLTEAHAVSERLESSLRSQVPALKEVTFHLESAVDREEVADVTDETAELVERVKNLVEKQTPARDCHDITVMRTEDGLVVSLSCCVDGDMSLDKSHDVASMVERKLKRKLRDIVEVYVHLEPT